MPGLHKSQTHVGEVYCHFSILALRQNREEVCQGLKDVISFHDSAGLKQGNNDWPVRVLRKSAGFGL